jgi:glycosyltransferase involved in cell wall biosynthesis
LVEFLREVEESRRVLLGNALALLFPIDWPEPFGLVMIEALASGTPVIARPCGSVPEVLRDGVTGLLCENEDAMVEAVHRVAALDRAACRQEFERRFTVQIMVQNYLKLYEATLRGKPFYPNISNDLSLPQHVYSPVDAKENPVNARRALDITVLPSK